MTSKHGHFGHWHTQPRECILEQRQHEHTTGKPNERNSNKHDDHKRPNTRTHYLCAPEPKPHEPHEHRALGHGKHEHFLLFTSTPRRGEHEHALVLTNRPRKGEHGRPLCSQTRLGKESVCERERSKSSQSQENPQNSQGEKNMRPSSFYRETR